MSITFNITARPDKPDSLKMTLSLTYISSTANNNAELIEECLELLKKSFKGGSTTESSLDKFEHCNATFTCLWDKPYKENELF